MEIEQEHTRLANGGQIVSDCQACLDLLYDNDEVTVAVCSKTASSDSRISVPWMTVCNPVRVCCRGDDQVKK